jgi:hypothetical protein
MNHLGILLSGHVTRFIRISVTALWDRASEVPLASEVSPYSVGKCLGVPEGSLKPPDGRWLSIERSEDYCLLGFDVV